jgi:hypothetical protein
MGAPGHGGERSRRAFDRAVARERDAIALHERAAVLHDATAGVLEKAAFGAPDGVRSENFLRRAGTERRLAVTARARACTVRARLTAEGVDVGEWPQAPSIPPKGSGRPPR